MTLNEIKKALYIQNPSAQLDYIANGNVNYSTILDTHVIEFKIPFEETKGGFFYPKMAAKELIRWLQYEPDTILIAGNVIV